MIYGKINHAIHPEHALKLELKGQRYKCDGCHQDGIGARYTCKERCDVHLHKDCAERPETRHRITHPFMPKCDFKFRESCRSRRCCVACGDNIKGYFYHCSGCSDKKCKEDEGFALHPCCANLELELQNGGMKFNLQKKVSSKCCSCGNKDLGPRVSGWSYVSADKTFHLHVSCVNMIILKNWERRVLGGGGGDDMALEIRDPKLHAIHPKHGLKLELKGPRYKCDGCHQDGFGPRYTCKERRNVRLHIDCAEPRHSITHAFMPKCHFKFRESCRSRRCCVACGDNIKGYFYHCSGCSDNECIKDGGFALHPCCTNLDRELQIDGMKFNLQKKVSSKCYSCGNKDFGPRVSGWSYVSADKMCHLHVSCAKVIILKYLESTVHGGSGGDDMALEIWDPKLPIALTDDRKKSGKYAKLKKIIEIVIKVISGIIIGDPTAMFVGLVSSLIRD